MGKKKLEEMAKQRAIFVKGCKEKNQIPEKKANEIFDLLEKFAGYGFNKSHAAAYAIVAYQTAYLKANYPVEFFCAMMTNDMADTAKLSQYINEARAFGIEVLGPDVNESLVHFAPAQSVVARASRPFDSNSPPPDGTPMPPTPFTSFDKSRPASICSRALPHWQQEGATYFVTFRLADSLPQDVFRRWRDERDAALREARQAARLADAEKLELAEKIAGEYAEKLEQHLDQSLGGCWLRNPDVAQMVENALRHFDGDRYLLGSYVIMPNHVHVLVRPAMEHKLPDILQSWKSFTAKEANKLLRQAGEFWQPESFDHIVRNEQQLEKFSRYIQENPVKAGLDESEYRLGGGLAARTSGPSEQEQKHTGGTPVPLHDIRFGLAAIKGVGEVAVQAILKPRNESGKFKSLSDLCERVESRSLGRKTLEALIKTGACDCFGETRKSMFNRIDSVLASIANTSDIRAGNQGGFSFVLKETDGAQSQSRITTEEWPQHELLAHEKELLGFYVTGHPLTPFAPILEKYTLANTAKLAELPNRSQTAIGGLIAAVQNGVSKKSGKPYSMVTLEDLEGSVQILCMNENYDKYRGLLVPNKAILVIGEVNTGDDRPKIFPQEILPLEDAPRKFTKQVHLRLHTAHLKPEQLESVRELVAAHPGKCPLLLCFMRPGGEVIFMDTNERFGVMPSLKLQQEADARFGEETYYAKVDTTLPDRAPRRWERKAESGNGEE
jgi:REP element-mobilizing transposase RayT